MSQTLTALALAIAISQVPSQQANTVVRRVYSEKTPGLVGAEPVRKPSPVYTREAAVAKVSAQVEVEITVGADGRVLDTMLLAPLDTELYGLDRAALLAASQWEFQPARLGGQPVATRVSVVFSMKWRTE